MITFAHVAQFLQDVTPEQIGRCRAVFTLKHKGFYLVESESEKGKEYRVAHKKGVGLTCTCKSGEHNFVNVKHPSGVCKHIRWAVACRLEEKQALAELEKAQKRDALLKAAGVSYSDVDDATLARIAYRNRYTPKSAKKVPGLYSRPFSIFKR